MNDAINTKATVRRSDPCNELAAALAAAQGEFRPIEKKREATVSGVAKKSGREYNYTYKYADLGDVLTVVLPILSKHKIALTQPTVIDAGIIYIRTTLLHASGQWQESDYPVGRFAERTHQQIGESLTYAKRYAACAALGVAPEETIEGDSDIGGDAEIGKPLPAIKPSQPEREAPTVIQSGDDQRPLPPVVGEPQKELEAAEREAPRGSPRKAIIILRPEGGQREFPATNAGALEALSDLEAQCAINHDAWEANKATILHVAQLSKNEEVKKRALALENEMEAPALMP